jgi:MFS family permease
MSLLAASAAWSVPRRWVVAAAATFGMLAGFGMATTVSVFIKPFEDEFGWLRADISFAYALFSAGAALGGLVVGWAFDRIDTRIIVVFGAIVMAACLAALAFTGDLATVQHIYLAAGAAGFACLYTPLIAVIGLWFDRGRGLAMGIVTAGGAIGQGMTPLLVQPMIAAFGWRDTCLMLGIGCAVILLPAMLLVTKPCAHGEPPQAGPASQPWALPPAISIGWLGLAGLLCCVSMAVPLVHLISLLTDRGEPAAISGTLLFVAMLGASAGRIVIGMICDRIGALAGYALAVVLQTATMYWFVPVQAHFALYLLAVAFGFGFGGVMTALVLCVRAAVPPRIAGSAMAVVGLLAWSGMGIGGYQGGYCFDQTGSYAVSFLFAVLAGVANLMVIGGLALHLRWHARIVAWLRRAALPGTSGAIAVPARVTRDTRFKPRR